MTKKTAKTTAKATAMTKSSATITTIGLDADDTLWHNETVFHFTEGRFKDLLAPYAAPEALTEHLIAVERRNLRRYGYGIKGFTLSMLETALEITDHRLPASAVASILEFGRDMLDHPVEPLDGVAETLAALAADYRLVLITKGDLMDQEQKLARSGLGDHFSGVEIVSEKTAETYRRVFARHGTAAGEGAMVGNSLRSDVIPALEAGHFGIHIPYPLVWALEHAEPPAASPFFAKLDAIAELPGWLTGRRG
ncbi:putative hydrolase of the HAD superfamily [Pseudoxanthobacter soli DSM 19599]|uniref:Putative hydrolase of the HAD superfamily n=2 Tax=Pseudoxanthobacter TaxID=433838 RepID=A0A1M7ZF51_9HYPH|nr:HAD family hydrolase [Pseudoxanthobacter soli]SHO63551.1 putative hydrolase of the HAD superfamily [Pseudoxanthobacter soli DSM 19599]